MGVVVGMDGWMDGYGYWLGCVGSCLLLLSLLYSGGGHGGDDVPTYANGLARCKIHL